MSMVPARLYSFTAAALAAVIIACLIWQISWLTTSGFALEKTVSFGDVALMAVFFALGFPAWSGWVAAPFLAARTRVPWMFLSIAIATLIAIVTMTSLSLSSGSHGFGRQTDISWNGGLWLLITWMFVMPSGICAAFIAFVLGRIAKTRA